MLDAQHLLWTQIAAGVCLLVFGGQIFNLFRLRSQMRAAESWGTTEGVITVSSDARISARSSFWSGVKSRYTANSPFPIALACV